MMRWEVTKAFENTPIGETFSSLEKTAGIPGDALTKSRLSHLKKCHIEGQYFYVKIYHRAGKWLRQWLGKSRVKKEWENLQFFQSIGIPTPPIVAFGQRYQFGRFQQGAVITQEIVDAIDISQARKNNNSFFYQRPLRLYVLEKIAIYTKLLHDHHFVHNDLKWRNILVQNNKNPTEKLRIFFIDCPLGAKKYGFLLRRGIVKDLACLDHVGKMALSKTDRLRFFLYYQGRQRLLPHDKKQIQKITQFFEGRE